MEGEGLKVEGIWGTLGVDLSCLSPKLEHVV